MQYYKTINPNEKYKISTTQSVNCKTNTKQSIAVRVRVSFDWTTNQSIAICDINSCNIEIGVLDSHQFLGFIFLYFFNLYTSSDIPVMYNAVLKKGKASALVLNNCIAQVGVSGLVNTVLQVVQKGLALVLFRVTSSSVSRLSILFSTRL